MNEKIFKKKQEKENKRMKIKNKKQIWNSENTGMKTKEKLRNINGRIKRRKCNNGKKKSEKTKTKMNKHGKENAKMEKKEKWKGENKTT